MTRRGDDGWSPVVLVCLLGGGLVAVSIWYKWTTAEPDMPFDVWLADASRDDVWLFLFGVITCGVGCGRILTGGWK